MLQNLLHGTTYAEAIIHYHVDWCCHLMGFHAKIDATIFLCIPANVAGLAHIFIPMWLYHITVYVEFWASVLGPTVFDFFHYIHNHF